LPIVAHRLRHNPATPTEILVLRGKAGTKGGQRGPRAELLRAGRRLRPADPGTSED